MSRPFKTLVERMTPEAQGEVRLRARALEADYCLRRLRQGAAVTQQEVASLLGVTQAHVSRFERQGDMLLSTLYAFVAALGGEVEIRARLPGRKSVRITQFEPLDRPAEARKG